MAQLINCYASMRIEAVASAEGRMLRSVISLSGLGEALSRLWFECGMALMRQEALALIGNSSSSARPIDYEAARCPPHHQLRRCPNILRNSRLPESRASCMESRAHEFVLPDELARRSGRGSLT